MSDLAYLLIGCVIAVWLLSLWLVALWCERKQS